MDRPTSKRKAASAGLQFDESWKGLYFLSQRNEEIHCLVCHKMLPSKRMYDLKRHYNACHFKEYGNVSGDDRLKAIERLKRTIEEKENQTEDVSFCKFVLEY